MSSAPLLCESAVSGHEPRNHSGNQPSWVDRMTGFVASVSAYVMRSRCMGAGNSVVTFTGLSSSSVPILSLAMAAIILCMAQEPDRD